jgi:2-(3-amino-3-carboxypropyl)histidine synthase
MIKIDEEKIFLTIREKVPKSVSLSGPDGLMHKIQACAQRITSAFDIPVYIIGDASWGSCDLNSQAAEILATDLLFNIGHTVSLDSFYGKVIMIDAFDDINFEEIATRCAIGLKKNGFKTISIVTNSQHLCAVTDVKQIFERYGYKVVIGKGKGQLNDSQVFGCEFYPATSVKDEIDAFVFLGQSTFHSAGIAIATEKPTFMLDPYFGEYSDVSEFASSLKKKALLSVYNSIQSKSIGIIVGLKEGQFARIKALEFKREFENLGKTVQLIAMSEITNDRIKIFNGIDIFIQLACPRISIDNHFSKPVLSTPQALTLIKLLKHEPVENFMLTNHWL